MLADCPGNARGQYPEYVAACLADTDHYADLDDDLFPTLDARIAEPDGHGDVPAVSPVRGQHTLDWAVEHVNHWGVQATVPVGTVPADVVLDVPATGCATVAIRNAQAVAHAGAAVDAHRRARVPRCPARRWTSIPVPAWTAAPAATSGSSDLLSRSNVRPPSIGRADMWRSGSVVAPNVGVSRSSWVEPDAC